MKFYEKKKKNSEKKIRIQVYQKCPQTKSNICVGYMLDYNGVSDFYLPPPPPPSQNAAGLPSKQVDERQLGMKADSFDGG